MDLPTLNDRHTYAPTSRDLNKILYQLIYVSTIQTNGAANKTAFHCFRRFVEMDK